MVMSCKIQVGNCSNLRQTFNIRAKYPIFAFPKYTLIESEVIQAIWPFLVCVANSPCKAPHSSNSLRYTALNTTHGPSCVDLAISRLPYTSRTLSYRYQ